MVCDTLIYHPTLGSLIKLLDSSAGREKLLRLLQFVCRLLADRGRAPLARALQTQFALARKILQFLLPLKHLQAAARLYDNKITGDSLERAFAVGKSLLNALYLSLDHVSLLRTLQLLPATKLTGLQIPKWTNWVWLAAITSGIAGDIRKAWRVSEPLREKEANVRNTLSQEFIIAMRKILWDLADATIVMNNIGLLSIRDETIAILGIATSIMGLQDMWV